MFYIPVCAIRFKFVEHRDHIASEHDYDKWVFKHTAYFGNFL